MLVQLQAMLLLLQPLTLSSCLPWNLIVLMTGQKRLNSFIQLPNVLFGTITMCGPLMPLYSWRYATKLMVCNVLPRPYIHTEKPDGVSCC